jgi:hypothetical protein
VISLNDVYCKTMVGTAVLLNVIACPASLASYDSLGQDGVGPLWGAGGNQGE